MSLGYLAAIKPMMGQSLSEKQTLSYLTEMGDNDLKENNLVFICKIVPPLHTAPMRIKSPIILELNNEPPLSPPKPNNKRRASQGEEL